MKKTIKLTENDIRGIVRNVLEESYRQGGPFPFERQYTSKDNIELSRQLDTIPGEIMKLCDRMTEDVADDIEGPNEGIDTDFFVYIDYPNDETLTIEGEIEMFRHENEGDYWTPSEIEDHVGSLYISDFHISDCEGDPIAMDPKVKADILAKAQELVNRKVVTRHGLKENEQKPTQWYDTYVNKESGKKKDGDIVQMRLNPKTMKPEFKSPTSDKVYDTRDAAISALKESIGRIVRGIINEYPLPNNK